MHYFALCEPVYEELPGWKTPTTAVRRWEDLPENARRYVERLGELVGCPAAMVTVGLHRDCTIVRDPILT
jgi:adenylosuccinate synthase